MIIFSFILDFKMLFSQWNEWGESLLGKIINLTNESNYWTPRKQAKHIIENQF